MKTIATYNASTGRITSMAVVPPGSGITSVTMDGIKGHELVVLSAAENLDEADDAAVFAHLRHLMRTHMIDPQTKQLVKSPNH